MMGLRWLMEDGVIGRTLTRAHGHVAVVYDGKQEHVPTQCKENFPVFIFVIGVLTPKKHKSTIPPVKTTYPNGDKNI